MFLRGVLRSYRSARLTRVQLSFVVPDSAGGTGRLSVFAGAPCFFCFESAGGHSFDELVRRIDQAPTGDTLRAVMRVSRQTPAGRQTFTRHVRTTAPTAIYGNLGFDVQVVRSAA